MLAIVFHGPMHWQIGEVPKPAVDDPRAVLVRVIAAGFCGSDKRRFFHTTPPEGYLKTSILGHELVGIVEEVGSAVHSITCGDRVVIEPLIPCDACAVCQEGAYQRCAELKAVGRDLPGGFAEYLVVPERCVHVVPEGVPSEEAVLVDPIAVCCHGLSLSTRVSRPGDRAVVIGDGSLGLLCHQVLRSAGVEAIVIGKHRDRMKMLKSMSGVDARVASEIPSSWANEFDVVVEAVGGAQAHTLELGIDLAARGGEVIVLGAFDAGYVLPLSARKAFAKELTLKGSFSYSTTGGRRDIAVALDLLQRRQVTGRHLIEVVSSLNEFDRALIEMGRHDRRGPIKLVMATESQS